MFGLPVFRGFASLVTSAVLLVTGRAADPSVGEWTMFGNGPGHTGSYPKTIGTTPFTAGWSKTFTTGVNQVAVSADTIYATTTGYFDNGMRAFALRVSDGSEKWSYPLPDAYSINPPSYSAGRVYFQRGDHYSDTHLWCLDASSGALLWAAPHAAQWENYKAPTIANGGVFVNGGSYGGMYGFDAITGTRRFFVELGQEDRWTPAYANGVVYSCVEGIFRAHDPQTGAVQWTRDLKTLSTGSDSYWSDACTPVVANGIAVVVGGGRILALDLTSKAKLWSLAGNYYASATPALVGNVVYVALGTEVKAYNAATGALVGTFSGMGTQGLYNQPLVTNDLLITANSDGTYVFNRTTFEKIQTLPVGGELTYAAGTLYVVRGSTLQTYGVVATESDPAPQPLPPPQQPQPQPNPSRVLGTTSVVWLQTVEHANIAYFLFDAPAKIERYDLANSVWLTPISLPDGPKSFTVSAAGIDVGFASRIAHFSLDGATETRLANTLNPVGNVFELDGLIYLIDQSGSKFTILDPATSTVVGAKDYTFGQMGISLARTARKFFGRTGGSPSDIVQTVINAGGSMGAQNDSPYHGDYPYATQTYPFPDEARIVDNAGIIYSAGDLSYLGSLAGAFDDVDFAGDAPVVLRGKNLLVGYSAGLAETGRKSIPVNQLRLYATESDAFTFAQQNGRGVVVTKTPLTELVPPNPGPAIDPTTLTYTPDAIEMSGDTVFLLSKLHKSVFRWSISQRKYLESVSLTEVPSRMAYSEVNNKLYVSFDAGRIKQVDLAGAPPFVETHFATTPQPLFGLATAGEFVFAADPSGAWATHYTFSPSGQLLSSVDWNYYSKDYVWNATQRKMYFTRDDTSPNDLHFETISATGQITGEGETPYHGDYAFIHPIRVAPEGTMVLLGTGDLFHATNLSHLGALANRISDGVWVNSKIYTLRPVYPLGSDIPSGGELQAWNAGYEVSDSGLTPGTPLRLFGLSDSLLLVSVVDGKPRFARHGLDLDQISSDPGDNPPSGGIVTRPNPERSLAETGVMWLESAQSGDIAYFLFDIPAKVERYDLALGTWLTPISLPFGPTHFTVTANGIFVSFDKKLSIFSLDGTTETVLPESARSVQWMHENNGKLYLGILAGYDNPNVGVMSTSSGVIVSAKSYFYTLVGTSFAKSKGKIFGRDQGYSPSDIVQITLNSDGSLNTQHDGPYHGDYPSASRTFLFPDEGRVVDNAGIIYSTGNLSYLGSFGGAFTDIAFAGNSPILLRGTTVIAYSNALFETGRKTLAGTPLEILIGDSDVVSFAQKPGRGIIATRTPLTDLAPLEPPAPIDPTYVSYTPDAIEYGGDVIYLLSKLHQSVFRWSVSERKYLPSISLTEVPTLMAYSPTNQRLYLTFGGGRIKYIDVSPSSSFTEIGFASTPQETLGLAAAGEYVFASDPSGAWNTHYMFSAEGTQLSAVEWNYASEEFIWNAAQRKIYFLRDDTSPNDLHWESIGLDGKISGEADSPYHGDYDVQHPIRVAPNGSIVVLGNGDVYNATSLDRLGSLGQAVLDATWSGERLYTLRGFDAGVEVGDPTGKIFEWHTSRRLLRRVDIAGTPLRLGTVGSELVAVSLVNDRPRFYRYSLGLEFLSVGPVSDPNSIDFSEISGVYFAEVADGAGTLKLQLNGLGKATGVLFFHGRRYPFSATFDSSGNAFVVVGRSGGKLTLTLSLSIVEGMPVLTGELSGSDWDMAVAGTRAMVNPPSGRFVFQLSDANPVIRPEVPPVAGQGSMMISRQGSVRFAGMIHPGVPFLYSAWVKDDGSISVLLNTAGAAGSIEGDLVLNETGDWDWAGMLQWTKPEQLGATFYPDAFETDLAFDAVRYQTRAHPLRTGADKRGILDLEGGDLVADQEATVRFKPNDRIGFDVPFEGRLRIHSRTGFISGWFEHPVLGHKAAVSGIVNQKANVGLGAFRGESHIGRFQLTPNDAP